MRPLDKPFDLVTLVVATGREEVQRTAGLQCAIDLLEVRVFRKAYSRLWISILALRTWAQNKYNMQTNFVFLYSHYRLVIVFHFVIETFDSRLYHESVWSGSAYDVVIRGTVDADHWSKLE